MLYPSAAKVGLLIPLVSKMSCVQSTLSLIQNTSIAVQSDPGVLTWAAVNFTQGAAEGNGTLAIFNTFPDNLTRQTHLDGPVGQAPQPDIQQVNILANKNDVESAEKQPIKFGLRVLVDAKLDQMDAVRNVFKSGAELVAQEPSTFLWNGVEFVGTSTFGIVDFFPTEDAQNTHLAPNAPIPSLLANATNAGLFATAVNVTKFDVLSIKTTPSEDQTGAGRRFWDGRNAKRGPTRFIVKDITL